MSLIAVADIGTWSTRVVAGRLEEKEISLAGVGKSKSKGVRNGQVVNPDKAGDSLGEARERAEDMASEEIRSLYIGVGGDGLSFTKNKATVTINTDDRIVRRKDVERLKEMVSSVEIDIDKKIISTIPQEFILDGQSGVTNPVGLQGRRLDVIATLITVSEKWVKNYYDAASQAGLDVDGLLPAPQCTGRLLLTNEERDRGKLLIDFGRETTELSVFSNGILVDYFTFPIGGKNLTCDLSAKFNVSEEDARKIKHDTDLSKLKETDRSPNKILQKRGGGRQEEIFSTLSARLEETFDLILSEARAGGHEQLTKYGIKITGGGSRLTGLVEFLESNFESSFERGLPVRPISGIRDVVEDPGYGNVLGLLTCRAEGAVEETGYSSDSPGQLDLFNRIKEKIASIISGGK